MESVRPAMDSFALPTICLVLAIYRLATAALSAFSLVTEAISSSEELVSSRDAACCDAPSASCPARVGYLGCRRCNLVGRFEKTCNGTGNGPGYTSAEQECGN